MNPAALILAAASAAGAILGTQKKYIDPKWLEEHFGAGAVSAEAQKLFNYLINSPYGQKLSASAAEQGQAFGRQVNREAAAAGLAGPGGTSGTGIFATAAGQGAAAAGQRDVSAGLYQAALPIAQQMVGSRLQAYLQDRLAGGVQTPAAAMWQKVGEAAGTIGSRLPAKTPSADDVVSAGTQIPTKLPTPSWALSLADLTRPLVPRQDMYSPNTNLVNPLR